MGPRRAGIELGLEAPRREDVRVSESTTQTDEPEGEAPEGKSGKLAGSGLWVVLRLAFLVRLAYGIEHTDSPDYAWPSVDAHYHDVWARSAAGLSYPQLPGFVDPELASTPSLRPAGYPWFLALIYKLTGGSYVAARVVQHLLGLLSVALVWFALRGRVPRWLALSASSVFALHFAPVYFEGELQATGLLIFLNLLGLNLFMGALERGGARRILLAAWILGLATLVRPNVLLPAALLGLYLVRRGLPPLPRAKVAGLFAMGLILGVLPGTVRNWVRAGEFMPLTATGGINLYLGQGPGADGLIQGDMGELGRFQTCFDYSAVKQHVERRVGRELTHGELDRWFLGQSLSTMVVDPGRSLSLMAVKLGLLFSGEEVGHNKEVGMERRGLPPCDSCPCPSFCCWPFCFGVCWRWPSPSARPNPVPRWGSVCETCSPCTGFGPWASCFPWCPSSRPVAIGPRSFPTT